MATSGTIYGAKVKSWYLKIDWERTEVSIENNQSTIKASLYVYNNNTAYNNYANEAYYTIDGTKTYAKFSFPSTKAWRLLGTKTFTITHDNDGSKKYTLSGYWYSGVISSSYTPESLSVSGTIALDTIPRKATVSKVTSFNDDGNPTITFTNLGGFNLAPYINIYQDETIIHKISRTKGEFTSPYTFSLTDAERTRR